MDSAFKNILSIVEDVGYLISDDYFNVKFAIESKDKEYEIKYRERVYCYELYHNLRCIVGDYGPFKLHAELDKRGHTIIKSGYKPDFVFHIPGTMNYNLLIMEVKHILNDLSEIKKDIDKIIYFLDKCNYFYGFILIYGTDTDDTIKKTKIAIEKELENKGTAKNRLYLAHHNNPREAIKIISI
jgi:hypothetical protein